MIHEQPTAEPLNKLALEPQQLIWHLEAALPEAQLFDQTAGFLLRVAIESLRKRQEAIRNGAVRDTEAA